jgi:hypothetical protein
VFALKKTTIVYQLSIACQEIVMIKIIAFFGRTHHVNSMKLAQMPEYKQIPDGNMKT